MPRFLFPPTLGFLAFIGLTLSAASLPAVAADIPAKHLRHVAPARHVSLMPIRAKIDTLGHIFEEPRWVDRDNVIAHANIPDGFFQAPYQINLRTEQFHILNLKPPIWNCKPAHWSLSSDKKWVLWRQGRLESTCTLFASRLDGRGSRSWEMATCDSNDSLWLLHSHRWVSFRVRQTDSSFTYEAALIHNLDAPKAPPRVVPLPARVRSAEDIVGALPDGHILMAEYPDETHRYVAKATKLFFVDLHAQKRMRQMTITLPKGIKRVSAIYLSPNGRSLAWDLCDAHDENSAFYVSDLSGRNMRLVKPSQARSDEGIMLRGWYSDSRALLFEVRQDKEVPRSDYLCWVAVPQGKE